MISLMTQVSKSSISTVDNEHTTSLEQRYIDKIQTNKILFDCNGVDIASKFLHEIHKLPPSDDTKTHADKISQLLTSFKNPDSGEIMFATLEQQGEILRTLLDKVNTDPALTEALTIVLISTSNLQSQMTIWMQDIIMSGGEIDDLEDW